MYPKDYALRRRFVKESSCFLMMPFKQELNVVYGNIKSFLSSIEIDCQRADDIFESQPILSTIIEQILSSEFIIADLTDRNPNVFYELGLAHSFRDNDCVILIAQNMNDIPFDIRHLPIIIYDINNKYLLEESLKNRVNVARKKIKKKRFLLDYFADSHFSYSMVENVIDSFKDKDPDFIERLHILLSDKDRKIDRSRIEIENIIDEIDSLRNSTSKEKRKLLTQIKIDILINIAHDENYYKYCISFLIDTKRSVFEGSARDDLLFSATFACLLIQHSFLKAEAVDWLLGYLNNSRVGGIDIIRNKVDEFLVSIDDSEIDLALLNLISNNNATLRESSVDILTQKGNLNAYSKIISNIHNEKNIYVVRSMINGLGRYNNSSSCDFVIKWFRNNKIIIEEHNSVFLCEVAIGYFRKFSLYHYAEEINRLIVTLS